MKVVESDAEIMERLRAIDVEDLARRVARNPTPNIQCQLAEAFRITDPVVGIMLFERGGRGCYR